MTEPSLVVKLCAECLQSASQRIVSVTNVDSFFGICGCCREDRKIVAIGTRARTMIAAKGTHL